MAPTAPRTSRASWAAQTASVSDVIARFRSAGLSVDPQPPATSVIYGAERLDLFLIQGEMTGIYTFATVAASARVLDDAANGRSTASYFRTPYFVQVANLLVTVTTDDPRAAGALIKAITGP